MICVACEIFDHALCRREPECDCPCETDKKIAEREFTPAQMSIIEQAEAGAVEP